MDLRALLFLLIAFIINYIYRFFNYFCYIFSTCSPLMVHLEPVFDSLPEAFCRLLRYPISDPPSPASSTDSASITNPPWLPEARSFEGFQDLLARYDREDYPFQPIYQMGTGLSLVQPPAGSPAISYKLRPLIPNVPSGEDGQMITYMLVLRMLYSNTWAELAAVYSMIFAHKTHDYIEQRYIMTRYPAAQMTGDEFRHAWRHRTMYMGTAGANAALDSLIRSQNIHFRFLEPYGGIYTQLGGFRKLLRQIGEHAVQAGVTLKEWV